MIKFILISLLILYALVLICAYIYQDKLLFFPQKFPHDFNFNLSSDDKEVFLKTSDGETINGIYITRQENKKVVLYFHGNGTSLNQWKTIANEFIDYGANLLMIDYRGYGKSTGTFSEQGFYNDAEAAYNYLKSNGYSDAEIFIYGRSLGSGVAVEMAARHNVLGLILESPYTSVINVAKKHHPYLWPQFLLKYDFNSLSKASQLKMPVLIFHGVKDEVIPVEQAETLNAAINSKKQILIFKDGDHANLSSYKEYDNALRGFLNQ
ncbi:MAG: alpha/beta hydrolase [Bacteroidia bacterium]